MKYYINSSLSDRFFLFFVSDSNSDWFIKSLGAKHQSSLLSLECLKQCLMHESIKKMLIKLTLLYCQPINGTITNWLLNSCNKWVTVLIPRWERIGPACPLSPYAIKEIDTEQINTNGICVTCRTTGTFTFDLPGGSQAMLS